MCVRKLFRVLTLFSMKPNVCKACCCPDRIYKCLLYPCGHACELCYECSIALSECEVCKCFVQEICLDKNESIDLWEIDRSLK